MRIDPDAKKVKKNLKYKNTMYSLGYFFYYMKLKDTSCEM